MALSFTLDNDFRRLDWGVPGERMPSLTEQQATIVAVASMASALDNIALQFHNALGPLQEIADRLDRSR